MYLVFLRRSTNSRVAPDIRIRVFLSFHFCIGCDPDLDMSRARVRWSTCRPHSFRSTCRPSSASAAILSQPGSYTFRNPRVSTQHCCEPIWHKHLGVQPSEHRLYQPPGSEHVPGMLVHFVVQFARLHSHRALQWMLPCTPCMRGLPGVGTGVGESLDSRESKRHACMPPP
jgi:hypothetical protein